MSDGRQRGRLVAICAATLSFAATAFAGLPEFEWDEGSIECASIDQPPLEVRSYDSATFILRQGLCATFEAPFLYLLVGSERALLIDTGAVADPDEVPVGRVVRELIEGKGLSLLVVHTHSHVDHRNGDDQFAESTLVSSELDRVREHFQFVDWPLGEAEIDLGDRIVTVLPAPGHHSAHLVFYDSRTGLLFSGDHLLPGRILIDDIEAFRDTTRRLVEFARRVDVTFVLGSHVELAVSGSAYAPGATHHPNERQIRLLPSHLLELAKALRDFNGVYEHHGDFVLVHVRNIGLIVLGGGSVLVAAFAWGSWRAYRYWRYSEE